MTVHLTLALTPDQRKWLKEQVAQRGYEKPDDYVKELLEREQLRQEHERIEDLLEEGVESPSRPLTEATWKRIRAKIRSHPKKAASK